MREMTSDDVDAAVIIDRKCFGKRDAWRRKYFLAAMMSLNSVYLVVEVAGKVIACAGAELRNDEAEIQTLAVDPDYHGRGIGTQLFAKLINTLRERGAAFVYLEVRPSNTPAIKLYEHFGFQVFGNLEKYYSNGDALLMMKNL
ncbi:MAG: ribosomal protein S18-alanine N-acetyltransferase [Selenomonadaceae bacterium]|nr:ribosomal protein S18-alanine N-acetyltransferase [Selenomonadaceae bacterium]